MARYSQKINEALTSRNNQLKKGLLFVIKNNTNQIYVGNGRCIRWIANSVQNGDNHLLWADGGKGILWSREAWVWQRGQSREKSDCSREELSRAECAGDPEVKALDRRWSGVFHMHIMQMPSFHTCKQSSEKSHHLDTIPQQIQQPGGVFGGLIPSPTPHTKTHHSLHHSHVNVNISWCLGGSTLPSVDELCRPVILGIPEAEVGGPESQVQTCLCFRVQGQPRRLSVTLSLKHK